MLSPACPSTSSSPNVYRMLKPGRMSFLVVFLRPQGSRAQTYIPKICYNFFMGLIHKTYQMRAYTSALGYDRLDFIMLNCARLYNAALAEWKAAYKHSRISRTLYDQMKELTGVRHDDPEFWGAISIQSRSWSARQAGQSKAVVLQAREEW